MSATPTGLNPKATAQLARYEKQALVAWHRENAGEDNGVAWWPLAIRELSLEYRLVLAQDEAFSAAWQERERRKVAKDPQYFARGYGSIQPEVGDAIPFELWPEQEAVLAEFIDQLRVVILKARQLGLTWLALHYALWLQAFCKETRNAKILALSKHGGDATKLLQRARQINNRLPKFLRQTESNDTARSLSRLKFEGRGEMISLAGTPDAARSETATLALVDEFAHIRNQQAQPTWTALQPTLGAAGKAIVIFTGNGPSNVPGDGQAAAKLFEQANSGALDDMRAVFLPSSVDPRRTDAWKKRMRATYLSDEDFEIEYAESIEQALQGKSGTKVYSPEGIDQAERLGLEFDRQLAAGTMSPPAGDRQTIGIDWGENTHIVHLWPLEKGGIYVTAELVATNEEPGAVTEALVQQMQEHPSWEGAPPPLFRYSDARYDAAGVQSNRTAMRVLRRRNSTFKSKKVAFSKYKRQTVNYLRLLFKRTADGHEAGIIAISPTCGELLRQLRGLELPTKGDPEVDAVNKKGDDHGADALVAGAAPIGAVFIGKLEAEREELRKQT